jgi:hypothetical protein
MQRKFPGLGSDYIQEIARNPAFYPMRPTQTGLWIGRPALYLYGTDGRRTGKPFTRPGGVRVIPVGDDGVQHPQRHGMTVFDLAAFDALAIQEAVEALYAAHPHLRPGQLAGTAHDVSDAEPMHGHERAHDRASLRRAARRR